ncbi:MAG: septum formation initiator family protein [Syntrophomonadaceae bacterium]|mgnify:CR=1 FL=1|jgi:cell division protein FtsL|nr:septum formation initiator family protein [Syntrophomonadaceae bacterium]NLX02387.1 septum formation initiator family protein [Syntrophomonadaceae bacterium]
MRKNNKKPRLKIILTGVLLMFLLVPVAPRVKIIWDLNQRIEQLENQKAELETNQQKLELELKQANSPATLERIAREQLGMVKKGETRVVEVLP